LLKARFSVKVLQYKIRLFMYVELQYLWCCHSETVDTKNKREKSLCYLLISYFVSIICTELPVTSIDISILWNTRDWSLVLLRSFKNLVCCIQFLSFYLCQNSMWSGSSGVQSVVIVTNGVQINPVPTYGW
jgi:hypothetical protein